MLDLNEKRVLKRFRVKADCGKYKAGAVIQLACINGVPSDDFWKARFSDKDIEAVSEKPEKKKMETKVIPTTTTNKRRK